MTAVVLPLLAVLAAFRWLHQRGEAMRALEGRAARQPPILDLVAVEPDPPLRRRRRRLLTGILVLAGLVALLLVATSIALPPVLDQIIRFES